MSRPSPFFHYTADVLSQFLDVPFKLILCHFGLSVPLFQRVQPRHQTTDQWYYMKLQSLDILLKNIEFALSKALGSVAEFAIPLSHSSEKDRVSITKICRGQRSGRTASTGARAYSRH